MFAHTPKLYTVAQIRELEKSAMQDYQLSDKLLMARAGYAAFKQLQCHWPNARHIIVFCGKGNNGGDGYVLAKLAQEHGLVVRIITLDDPSHLKSPAAENYQACLTKQIAIERFSKNINLQADVIVDALLGIGAIGNIQTPLAEVIAAINQTNVPVLAIDVPSGINADTGTKGGVAIHATVTITFLGMKQGLLTGNALDHCGEIYVDDCQLPEILLQKIPGNARAIGLTDFNHHLKRRARDSNKGAYGHVLIIGGDQGMTGAAHLAAEAALRTGAGLVSVATRALIGAPPPEIMYHAVANALALEPLLQKASVIAIGPGLGQDAWGRSLFEKVISLNKPLVVDADALNLLATMKPPLTHPQWILTPHPGEAARLLQMETQQIAADRFLALNALQQRYGGVVLLKGAGTLIQGETAEILLSTAGNPGMASGGMGDVLTGIIAALLAQHVPSLEAAALGACIHGTAGDLAAQDGERGLLASDLIQKIKQVVNPTWH